MTSNKMNIIPGVGIGEIQYGVTEEELIAIMGRPDKVDEEENVEGSGDWQRELWYSSRNISFTFSKEDNYKLGTITIMGSGYTLFGKDLFNSSKTLVRKIIAKHSGELMPTEDHSYFENETHECLNSNQLGIMFWFDSNNLSEMQCSYLFEPDNETVIWPTSHNKQSQLTRRVNTPLNLAGRYETKKILTTFASSFVNKPFRDRFVVESMKKPVDLHRRICHDIEKVFDHKFKNNNHTFKQSELCLFLGWFSPIKELTWKEAEKIIAEGGGGYLVINSEGTKFYAETEAYPSEKYAGSNANNDCAYD